MQRDLGKAISISQDSCDSRKPSKNGLQKILSKTGRSANAFGLLDIS